MAKLVWAEFGGDSANCHLPRLAPEVLAKQEFATMPRAQGREQDLSTAIWASRARPSVASPARIVAAN
jgi:hypothetical protein